MTRILTSLYTLSELEMKNRQILHLSSSVLSVENLSSVLVELAVRALGILEMERANSTESFQGKIAGNIMTNPKTTFIYMGESLLSFATKLIELANRESVDGGRNPGTKIVSFFFLAIFSNQSESFFFLGFTLLFWKNSKNSIESS